METKEEMTASVLSAELMLTCLFGVDQTCWPNVDF